MLKVYKLPVPPPESGLILMIPHKAYAFEFEMDEDGENPIISVLLDPEEWCTPRRFVVYRTGWSMPERVRVYLGAIYVGDTGWYLFEEVA
ncbi:hypothetical protein LCGC14_1404950 [marine sediment metagenome]|uniref:DUF7352 domain-containing protein n=1 Tax=marine sediment metagenome TaxID=412755 RepID=A0A0F9MXI9_9ZZZZ